MADLKMLIEKLASDLAAEVVAAVRQASLDELAGVGPTKKPGRTRHGRGRARKPGRVQRKAWGNWGPPASKARVRRSPAQLQKIADQIVATVKAHKKGINAKDIKTKMGLTHGNVGAKVFTKPLAVALASKKITKKGKKRATTYYAA